MDVQKQDDQLELTYSSYVRTQDVIPKTCQRRWIIGRRGERGSGISVLAARHDDDDDIANFNTLISFIFMWNSRVYIEPRNGVDCSIFVNHQLVQIISCSKYSLLFLPVIRIEPATSWWFHSKALFNCWTIQNDQHFLFQVSKVGDRRLPFQYLLLRLFSWNNLERE